MADTPMKVYKRDIQLTNAQIKTLRATPVELIPTPGNSKVVVAFEAIILKETSKGAYTTGGGNNQLGFDYSSGGTFFTITGGAHDLTSAGRKLIGSKLLGDETVLRPNESIRLVYVGNAELTGGHADNTLSIRIYYSIVPADPFTAGASQD